MDIQQRRIAVGSVFTPGSPVSEKDLFAGRIEQLNKVLDASAQRGYHAVVFGERGVGKTSLSNIIAGTLRRSPGWLTTRVNCDGSDNYSSLWRKALQDIVLTQTTPGLGFGAAERQHAVALVESAIIYLTKQAQRAT